MRVLLTAVLFFFCYGPVTLFVQASPTFRPLLEALPTEGACVLLWPLLVMMMIYGLLATADATGTSFGDFAGRALASRQGRRSERKPSLAEASPKR